MSSSSAARVAMRSARPSTPSDLLRGDSTEQPLGPNQQNNDEKAEGHRVSPARGGVADDEFLDQTEQQRADHCPRNVADS